MLRDFTILIEEDYASNNVSAYIPELRLNVVGDTEDEVIASAQDLIQAEYEKHGNQNFMSLELFQCPLKFQTTTTLLSSLQQFKRKPTRSPQYAHQEAGFYL
ncbi:hypothetical protein [Paenibacillus sp. GbtcB18]|uniref:hypothetical protein n=1 Tax=Paenibacillus sp. GbtcB18 TaxID=2824763 RepID=UPI001C2FE6D6|nr:hypothetical protein [Paenibacillus sp. GbtcB18]